MTQKYLNDLTRTIIGAATEVHGYRNLCKSSERLLMCPTVPIVVKKTLDLPGIT